MTATRLRQPLRPGCSSSTTSPTSSSCCQPASASPASRWPPLADGNEALRVAASFKPDLLLLDVMMPGIDGFEVVRRLRQEGRQVPVLFLTAKDATEDKITGLTLGGDDYVTKPFSLEEVIARVRAVLRRFANTGPATDSARLSLRRHRARRRQPRGLEGRRAGHPVAHRVQTASLLPAEPDPGAVQSADPRPCLALRLRWRRQRRRVLRLLPAPQDRHHRTPSAAHDSKRRLRPPRSHASDPRAGCSTAFAPRRAPHRCGIKLSAPFCCSRRSASASPASPPRQRCTPTCSTGSTTSSRTRPRRRRRDFTVHIDGAPPGYGPAPGPGAAVRPAARPPPRATTGGRPTCPASSTSRSTCRPESDDGIVNLTYQQSAPSLPVMTTSEATQLSHARVHGAVARTASPRGAWSPSSAMTAAVSSSRPRSRTSATPSTT